MTSHDTSGVLRPGAFAGNTRWNAGDSRAIFSLVVNYSNRRRNHPHVRRNIHLSPNGQTAEQRSRESSARK